MTPRERYIQTLTFGTPDKVPFQPGWPRESTLAAWQQQGLPADVNWWDFLWEQLGLAPEPERLWHDLGVDFRMIPQFEEEVLERSDGRQIVQDWKGNICEIGAEFDVTYLRVARDFVTRRWLSCPVTGPADWPAMRARYNVDAPGRFPADFDARCAAAAERDTVLSISFPGPFWQMREWCGFEGLCLLMVEQPTFVDEMAAFWSDFVSAVLERIFARIAPDALFLSEDMAYKAHAMISPAMTRRFCLPAWTRWTAQARAAGVPIVDMDSDGFVGELVPLWIEAGMNVNDPVEVAAHNDVVALRATHGRAMAYRGGVDKRLMAAGGRKLRDEIARIEPVVRDGGYIPGCDHGVPSDVSWPNYLETCELLARVTGCK